MLKQKIIYIIYIYYKISGMPPAHYFRNLGKNQGSGPNKGFEKEIGLPTHKLVATRDVSL